VSNEKDWYEENLDKLHKMFSRIGYCTDSITFHDGQKYYEVQTYTLICRLLTLFLVYLTMVSVADTTCCVFISELERSFTYNLILRSVRVTIIAVGEQ